MKTKNILMVAFLGLVLGFGRAGAADLPADETAFKAAAAAEAKALKAINDYCLTGTDPAELTSLQAKALEMEARLKDLHAKQTQKLEGNPTWSAKAAEIKSAKEQLAQLKKEGKEESPEGKALLASLAKLNRQQAQIMKPFADPQIDELNVEKRRTLQRMFILTMTQSPAAKPLVEAYAASISARESAHKALVAAQGKILPFDYIASFQPKPYFKPGHTLPPLTRYGWLAPFPLRKLFAQDWGYAVEFSGYTSDSAVDKIDYPFSDEAKAVELVNSDPSKFKLAVICDRYTPATWSSDIWCQDANGHFLSSMAVSMDGTEWNPGLKTTYRLTAPEDYWIELGRGRAKPLERLRKRVPISLVLNGGEYGIGVWGFAGKVWQADPRDAKFLADQEAKGINKYEAAHLQKMRAEELIGIEVKKAVPDRLLYVYYTSGGCASKGVQPDWHEWGGLYKDGRGRFSDIPSNEHYVGPQSFNTGFMGEQDLLSKSLNAIGEQIALGDTLAYSWFWLNEKKVEADYRRYRGLLKCYYVTGVIGGNAGTYNTPDFVSPFDPKNPPNWLVQQMELGKVHALFTHLEDYIRNGDLVDDGKYKLFWWPQQPAYELLPEEIKDGVAEKEVDGQKVSVLVPGRAFRVLARKHRQKEEWLVAAWSADGQPHQATVTIPGAGRITLEARSGGSTCLVKLKEGKPVSQLVDADEEDPSGEFRKLAGNKANSRENRSK
jgi:hypothetical protein